MEDLAERGYVIVSSPDEVVTQLTGVATDLNVGHLMLLLKWQGLFSEWEDRWWPEPMPRLGRAQVAPFEASLAAD
jgi:hypothetical protein